MEKGKKGAMAKECIYKNKDEHNTFNKTYSICVKREIHKYLYIDCELFGTRTIFLFGVCTAPSIMQS